MKKLAILMAAVMALTSVSAFAAVEPKAEPAPVVEEEAVVAAPEATKTDLEVEAAPAAEEEVAVEEEAPAAEEEVAVEEAPAAEEEVAVEEEAPAAEEEVAVEEAASAEAAPAAEEAAPEIAIDGIVEFSNNRGYFRAGAIIEDVASEEYRNVATRGTIAAAYTLIVTNVIDDKANALDGKTSIYHIPYDAAAGITAVYAIAENGRVIRLPALFAQAAEAETGCVQVAVPDKMVITDEETGLQYVSIQLVVNEKIKPVVMAKELPMGIGAVAHY